MTSVAQSKRRGQYKTVSKPTTTNTANIYQRVTDSIVSALEAGTRPWIKPWTTASTSLPLRVAGEAYRGINVLTLWASAVDGGYSSPHWLTYQQAQELGGQVRRGEKGTAVVWFQLFQATKKTADGEVERDQDGQPIDRNIPVARSYIVFNADQIDGLPKRYYPEALAIQPDTRVQEADDLIAATGAKIDTGCQPHYCPAGDSIGMPAFESFNSAPAYYSAMFHELAHWTAHRSRLNRLVSTNRNTEEYALEELVAELASSFVCARLGIPAEADSNSAAYIDGWLARLKGDKRYIFRAASGAQKIADYLMMGSDEDENE